MDAIKQRFLQDRVLTATPAQRVVMLYDRLALDLARARAAAEDTVARDTHLDHATRIIAELLGSLDHTAGGPAGDLAALYDYALRTLMGAQLSGSVTELSTVEAIVEGLRDAWRQIAEGAATGPAQPALTGSSWTA